MSDQNETPVDTNDDLDAFSAEFFGQNKQTEEEPAKPSEDVEPEINEEETPETETETDSSETHDDDEQKEEKPKKGRFQERIDELTTARREAERREAALQARLDALEKAQKAPEPEKPAPVVEAKAPSPEDKNEDGSDKYQLGEFDPAFIRDLTKFTLNEEREALRREADERSKQTEADRTAQELNSQWEEKLTPARERYPDFQEKAETLVDVFSDLDQQYGDFLAQTIMSMDNGTDVLYYLANNHDEAQAIVKSGATKAAIALGRIEAKVTATPEEKPQPRLTQAPTPPPRLTGSAAGTASVPDDTDDLEAFSKKFFQKKK